MAPVIRRRKTVRALAFALLVLAGLAVAQGQQPLSPTLQAAVGQWQAINDDGKPNGHVETYLVDGKLFGKVTQLRPGASPGELCTKCKGDLKNQPILGLVIRNFQQDGEVWAGGTVVDPDNGKEYRDKIWTTGHDQLHLRGFIGISLFGRSQTWTRLP
ncbi:MAG: DUF2147 domain-containing protein [Candidatus Korobacteraceae bacterium]